MTVLHSIVTWFNVALTAATFPDPAGDAIRRSGLQPEAFSYLAVSHQRTAGRQISLVLGIWLAVLTLTLICVTSTLILAQVNNYQLFWVVLKYLQQLKFFQLLVTANSNDLA